MLSCWCDLVAGDKYTDGDRQIIGWSGLAKIGWSQVHCNAPQWKSGSTVPDGGANSLLRLVDRRIRQTYDGCLCQHRSLSLPSSSIVLLAAVLLRSYGQLLLIGRLLPLL
jgi:hypothetical protein